MQILSLIFLLNSQKEEIVGQEHIFVRKLIVFELKKNLATSEINQLTSCPWEKNKFPS